ncbi:hypothetical protein [Pseudonocardia sp. ICBG1293]|uniref:hypothetical protein n=1 Tax=Pseudonocardia sp. ICBG1293 TaxID=2844382 RepID=UPI001CC9AB72|nr:hypothetical protein [Pseudonocardia sp. ICBG1293]
MGGTDTASVRMTVTGAMLDDDGTLTTGHLLVLAESAGRLVLPSRPGCPSRCVIDVLGPRPGAGAVLLAGSTTRTAGEQIVVDTVVRREDADRPVLAVVRQLFPHP